MPDQEDGLEERRVSGTELAALLGLTDRRIRQLAREGIFPKEGRGRYVLGPSVRGYARYLGACEGTETGPDPAPGGMVVAGTTLATFLGVSERRVQQLAQEGRIPRTEHGKYPLRDSVTGYLRFLQEDSGNINPKDLDKETTRLRRAQADKAELEVQVMRAELHPAEAVAEIWGEMIGAFRARMLAVPVKLAPRLQGEEDLGVIRERLRQGVHEALKELAGYDPERITRKAVSRYSNAGCAAS
ncbi:hypothetical protein KAR29_04820 [Aminithiophilus ramosus]|uniref:Helix-turn-helix domain-containing protein n=1 Tax=Aminithiophilus ramosus TaxID=3029084 RepID=A0A9Q7EY83_9BACT|nr:hypothetical protein [Aminithiophilus ramosus]QTX33220.1 hypothetical protein KAR29_04820 [Aminithiophilus ramosus]